MNVDSESQEDAAEELKELDNGEQFFFHGGIVPLSLIKLPAVECNGEVVLDYNTTKLEVARIREDVKVLGEVGIT